VAAEVARGRARSGGICGNGRGVAGVRVRRVRTALSTPEGKRWEKVGWKDGRRGCSGEEGHCKKCYPASINRYSGYMNMWLRQIWRECNDEGSYADEQTGGGFMM
jgi:hypothetical protein